MAATIKIAGAAVGKVQAKIVAVNRAVASLAERVLVDPAGNLAAPQHVVARVVAENLAEAAVARDAQADAAIQEVGIREDDAIVNPKATTSSAKKRRQKSPMRCKRVMSHCGHSVT